MRISDWSSDVCSSDLYADFLDRALEHELEVVCAGAVRVARPHAFVAAFVAAQVRCVVDEERIAQIVARGVGEQLLHERCDLALQLPVDRKSTRLNSSH